MAVYEVHSEPVIYKYKSTLCSKSAIFSAITSLISIILPFLIGYRSHGFWLKSSLYREQPNINFKHSYLLYLETEQVDSPILCSNLPVTREFDYCTVIKSREEDFDQDGKKDNLVMNIEVEVPYNLSVFSAQLVLIFDYKLQKHCLLQMEGAVYIAFQSGLPFTRLDVTGEIKLKQKKLLMSKIKDVRYNTSVFNVGGDSSGIYSLQEALRNYGKREVVINIENEYKTWTTGVLLNEPFTISLNIMYLEDIIHYRPAFWQIMKWAWQQYLSLLIIFIFICRLVKSYVFSTRLVPTLKEIPWSRDN